MLDADINNHFLQTLGCDLLQFMSVNKWIVFYLCRTAVWRYRVDQMLPRRNIYQSKLNAEILCMNVIELSKLIMYSYLTGYILLYTTVQIKKKHEATII